MNLQLVSEERLLAGPSPVPDNREPASRRSSSNPGQIDAIDESEPSPLLGRIRAEYREMPGLRLTLCQARRLWNLDETACGRALQALVDAGYLTQTESGAFGLVTTA